MSDGLLRFFIIYSPQGALLLLVKYGESAVRGGKGAVITRVIKLGVLFNINGIWTVRGSNAKLFFLLLSCGFSSF